jgi:cytochrome c-type biogenesis protein CcmE
MEDCLSDPDRPAAFQPLKTKKKPFNKFLIGGLLIVAAVIILAVTSLRGNTQYYLTINELLSSTNHQTQNVRISGVVLGDSIHYDAVSNTLTFTVANIPGDNATIEKMGGLAATLHTAAVDPSQQRVMVVYNGSRPDLLTNEAQAIMAGSLDSAGVFHASELLLKCPSRYEDSLPAQAGN